MHGYISNQPLKIQRSSHLRRLRQIVVWKQVLCPKLQMCHRKSRRWYSLLLLWSCNKFFSVLWHCTLLFPFFCPASALERSSNPHPRMMMTRSMGFCPMKMVKKTEKMVPSSSSSCVHPSFLSWLMQTLGRQWIVVSSLVMVKIAHIAAVQPRHYQKWLEIHFLPSLEIVWDMEHRLGRVDEEYPHAYWLALNPLVHGKKEAFVESLEGAALLLLLLSGA